MTNSKRILSAFLCGQAVQVGLMILAGVMEIVNIIPWTVAAGFIITFSISAGMAVVEREVKEAAKRGK